MEKYKYPAIYVLYDHPADYPEYWVIVRWYGLERDDSYVKPFPTLESARESMLSMGLVILTRMEGDDPIIYETYI